MQRPRHQFFARVVLAENQHVGIGGSHFVDCGEHLLHWPTCANHIQVALV